MLKMIATGFELTQIFARIELIHSVRFYDRIIHLTDHSTPHYSKVIIFTIPITMKSSVKLRKSLKLMDSNLK